MTFYYIKGIEKIHDYSMNFKWDHVSKIYNMEYSIILNEFYEHEAELKIDFGVYSLETDVLCIKMVFRGVKDLRVDCLSAQSELCGFEIVNTSSMGYESDRRYHINDYEDAMISFYCRDIEVVEVNEVN